MPLIVSDEQLQEAGLTEHEARIELACRSFEANRMTLFAASRLAGMDRTDFELALLARGIAIYCPTKDELLEDIRNLREIGI